jgi:hypothetical protein
MKRHFILFFSLWILCGLQLKATIWHVGPSHTYTMPSQVSILVQDGDTILIDAGVYNTDVAKWTANNLLLKGSRGMAHLKANGASYGGKAIWVIAGNNTRIDSVEFSLCTVTDHNGAGIRQEGINLTVQHCYFHDNENGILAGDNVTSDILIEFTEFDHNGYGDGYSHNLYINHVNSLIFRYNYSHRAHVGHELKSRAYTNYILYNRIANEDGDASREIDLPNGGTSIVIGNEIEQGPNSQNSNVIGYGLEGLTNPTAHELYLVNNTIVNDKSNGSFLQIQNGIALYKAYNNLFAGPGTTLLGSAVSYDTSNNIRSTIASAGLVNPVAFDYHLLSSSPAINSGANPGYANSYSLTPVYEYVHPTDTAARIMSGQVDVGAHEYQFLTDVFSFSENPSSINLFPNPAHDYFHITFVHSKIRNGELEIGDITGRVVYKQEIDSQISTINCRWNTGIYFVKFKDNNGNEETLQKLLIH